MARGARDTAGTTWGVATTVSSSSSGDSRVPSRCSRIARPHPSPRSSARRPPLPTLRTPFRGPPVCPPRPPPPLLRQKIVLKCTPTLPWPCYASNKPQPGGFGFFCAT
jgi:hypothetical protein